MINELVKLIKSYAKSEVSKVLLIACSILALLNVLLAILFTLFFTKETIFIFLVYLCSLVILNLLVIIGVSLFWLLSRNQVKESLITCVTKIIDSLFFQEK